MSEDFITCELSFVNFPLNEIGTTTKSGFNIGGLTSVVKKIDVNVSAVA